ncbi:MAG: LytTR family DNA-binding domain-containing protein [Bacteroidales bacterium]
MIKLLIIDDEPEVRDLLAILLRNYPDLEVVGQASNVDQAIQLTREVNPDVVLLDIQMPEKDGFNYIEELKNLNMFPGIIFITAFENYAIRAIKTAAFDYLLKPIRREELFGAIDRYREYMKRGKLTDIGQLIDLLNKAKPGRIRLNTRTGYFFVDPEEIIYIEADGNYSHIKLISGKSETSTLNIGNLEKLILKGTFLRISRSFIINMKYISRVDRRTNLCEMEFNGYVNKIKIPAQKIKLLEGYF